MPADPTRSPSPPPRHGTLARIEFLDYQGARDSREYRLALHTPDGDAEVRFRIETAAFTAERVLLQDGPDVCYQRLARMLAADEWPSRDVITIDRAELAAYREAHTPAPRRTVTPKSPPKRTPLQRTPTPQSRPKLPVAAPAPTAVAEPAFDAGQRVRHSVYGVGVTMASIGRHTSVQFDEHGVRTFVTSMLELEALSAPHEWETGPRGKNRPRGSDLAGKGSGKLTAG